MENLGGMADSRYTGFREITDRDVLELHCIKASHIQHHTIPWIPSIRGPFYEQGPVFQSMGTLTSLLMTNLFAVVAI